MVSLVFVSLFLLDVVVSDIPYHLVTSLPGLLQPLPTRQWSGYIDVPYALNNNTLHFHYWLVENAAADPSAPTVTWFNGGPGSSSLIGFFTELGAFTLNDFSFQTQAFNKTQIPSVFANPYSWHLSNANMLFVEHPCPTGFSYCDKPCPSWNDTTQAEASYGFLVEFFARFPELASNRFLMTGESYAGVLVPTLSLQILAHRTKDNMKIAPWNLEGFALGNACPGNRVFTCTPYSGWMGTQVAVDFRYGHGMISERTYNVINEACEGQWNTFDPPSAACAKVLEDPIRPVLSETGDTDAMGGGYFLYDTCDPDLLKVGPKGFPIQASSAPRSRSPPQNWLNDNISYPLNAGEYACGQEAATLEWLNREDVRKAIHVQTLAESGRPFAFGIDLNYSFTAFSLLEDYKSHLIPAFRILQWSGDADQCVPYVGTQRWIDSLNLNESDAWRPWMHDEKVAGYTSSYQNGRFTFATVRGAGHMAPRYKPAVSLQMFNRFLSDKPM